MKSIYLLLSPLVFLNIQSFAQEGFDDFDDVYSDNTRQVMTSSSSQSSSTEYVKGEDPATWIEQDEYYDPSYNSKVDSSEGNTYITNNYYGGNYHYSNRFNRFNNVNNGWNDPFWNTWVNPGWNVGWNSWNGWGVGYNIGWGNLYRYNRWGNPYTWGGWNYYNPYWNNGWGYNGWGYNGWNNNWAYNQGFTQGVLAANGGGFETNSRGVTYGHRGSRGTGSRVSSVYGDRRAGARVYNSSGKSVENNVTAYTGPQSQGFSLRTSNTGRNQGVAERTNNQARSNSVGMDNAPRRATSTRGEDRQVENRASAVSNSTPRTNPTQTRIARPTSPNSGRTVPSGVRNSRSTPTRSTPARSERPSTTPNRVAIGSPSRATVGSSTPRRTSPSSSNRSRATSPTRKYTPSPRSVTPSRTYQPNRTSPSRSRSYTPNRTAPNRSYTPSRSAPSRSYTPSRSSSPSRSSRGSSTSSSGSSRGGRR